MSDRAEPVLAEDAGPPARVTMDAAEAATMNERAVEVVLGWARISQVGVEGGGITGAGWLAPDGEAAVAKPDGTEVMAPAYRVIPGHALPDFTRRENSARVIDAMLAAGYELQASRPRPDVHRCSFGRGGAFPEPIEAADFGEAIVRAALLARGA